MTRTISLTAVCLILASANSAIAQKPFKNKTALAAKKAFENERKKIEDAGHKAIAKAKKEYAAKLEIAIKEAGGAGKLDEANLLATEKKRIDGSNTIEKTRKRLEGMRWVRNSNISIKLNPNRHYVTNGGEPGVWLLANPRTLILQSHKSFLIGVFKFNETLTQANVYYFQKQANPPRVFKKR